ncbi:hypothetical protein NEFER03_1112 [Nematocida sp. LUAm3]|nr:hypothetical protein NEFER03_1112 [Nematocida sp. LUAm3]KAI5176310.1 hypothetical protein NEFER02_2098 [Nematocida sp. LUAm2]KAI5178226.1 hypothetical protein NEFER01_1393 [Nematocida sp. LUAm1]
MKSEALAEALLRTILKHPKRRSVYEKRENLLQSLTKKEASLEASSFFLGFFLLGAIGYSIYSLAKEAMAFPY